MRRLLLLAVLTTGLCAGRARAETLRERYWRTHRERNPVTRYGAPPAGVTNSLCPVEFVEFTGSQIVDLGLVFTPRDKVEADWQFKQVSTKQQRVFSQRPSGTGLHVELYINGSGNFGYAYERDNLNGWLSRTTAVTTNRAVLGIDGPSRRMYCGSGNRWSIEDLSALTDEQCGTNTMTFGRRASATPTHARLYGCQFWKDNELARDLVPVKDAAGAVGLFDLVSKRLFLSTTDPLVAGPELRPATLLPSVDRETAREMLAPAPTGEPRELAGGDLWLDCLAIPEGNWLCECPIAGTTNTAWRVAFCPSNVLRAVVWRHSSGLAPGNLPVTLEHDPSRVIGRIERLYYEAGTGVVARISVTPAGYGWAVSNNCFRPSPDVRATYANVVLDTRDWTYEHQDYLDQRVIPMLRREGTAAALAEIDSFAAVTNLPSSIPCLVMAPVYLRGLSLVELPLLPTYVERPVPEHLRDVYPIRPPRRSDRR